MATQKLETWAVFGAMYGLVIGLLLTFFAAIFGGLLIGLEGIGIVISVGAGLIVSIALLALMTAIYWVFLGLFYISFLKKYIQKFHVLIQLFLLTLISSVLISLFTGFNTTAIQFILSGVVATLIVFVISQIFKLKLPIKESG